jgi:Tfp pilus assembly protein FimV
VRPGEAQSAFIVGTHLAGQGDFESARGALLGCISADDPEWSPRAAGMLGEMLWDRGDPDGAEPILRQAVDAGHPQWSASAGRA